jgi:glutaminyl-tRNA synthetase
MAAVRILAIENLQNDLNNFSLFETQLSELKSIEKTKSVTIKRP